MTEPTGTVLVPADDWEIAVRRGGCRWAIRLGSGNHSKWRACGRPARFQLWRGTGPSRRPWLYCEDHTYGHVWLGDGMFHPAPLEETGWRDLVPA